MSETLRDSPFAAVRRATREVMETARFVTLERSALDALARRWFADLGSAPGSVSEWDVETHFVGTPSETLTYVLVLDTLNFGSGWFPLLRKRPGRSGYYVLSMGLKEHFHARGPWTAAELQAVDAGELARITGQRAEGELAGLFDLYALALRDLGILVEGEFGGSFEALVAAAGHRAARLVRSLARMPLFRDVATYPGGAEIPFYKRAQIAVSDLAAALGGRGLGRFDDLADLTAFADNALPHVLRCEGVLHYAADLAARIDRGELLAPGSPPEVEIRAAAVQGVEALAQVLRSQHAEVTARELDAWLWQRARGPEYKARPRHRTRTPYY